MQLRLQIFLKYPQAKQEYFSFEPDLCLKKHSLAKTPLLTFS